MTRTSGARILEASTVCRTGGVRSRARGLPRTRSSGDVELDPAPGVDPQPEQLGVPQRRDDDLERRSPIARYDAQVIHLDLGPDLRGAGDARDLRAAALVRSRVVGEESPLQLGPQRRIALRELAREILGDVLGDLAQGGR
jgi:hypothetical protein